MKNCEASSVIMHMRGKNMVRFQVLTVVSMKITALWDIEPCSFVEID
jgi:hypothetical protein